MEKYSKEIIEENFNTIRTNINFLGLDKEMKVFMVTSSIKDEGKTTISCHVASSYASLKKKVLLIDCDLRSPKVNKEMAIFQQKGLADLIMAGDEAKSYQDYIIKINEYLDVITVGFRPPNPSEMISSKRLGQIIANLRNQYDIIILDTPPVLLVSDAVSLNKLADGVLLVIKYGFTTKEILKESKKVFEVAGIRPLACIFNAVPNHKKRNRYYGAYGYLEDHKPGTNKKKPNADKKVVDNESMDKFISVYRRKIK